MIKIEEFKEVISGSDPYHHANYSMQSIFDKINVDAFVKGFLSLSNEHKDVVYTYIGHRYEQLYNSTGLREYLLPDKDNLQAIRNKLEEVEQQLECIDKLQVNKFIKMIKNATAEL